MALVVQKYGGSSVSDIEAMRRVARRVVATREAGNTVVVVVSAMGDTTDDLLDMAGALTGHAPAREMDILLSAGERISMALLAMAVGELGVPARAYTGAQAGVLTDSKYGRASIVGVIPERIARAVQMGAVAIVAGFQGVNEVEDVTTLGRGGSDTTAVALAAALNADVCEIYTDVDGLFTADPRIVPTARRVEALSSEETLEMAAHGAKILHLRAVEYARRFGVPIHVRSSFSDKTGTWIYDGRRAGAFVPPVIPGPAPSADSADSRADALAAAPEAARPGVEGVTGPGFAPPGQAPPHNPPGPPPPRPPARPGCGAAPRAPVVGRARRRRRHRTRDRPRRHVRPLLRVRRSRPLARHQYPGRGPPPQFRQGGSRGSPRHLRHRARPQPGQDHARRRAGCAGRRRPHLRDRGEYRRQYRHDRPGRLRGGHGPDEHLLHLSRRRLRRGPRGPGGRAG